MKKLVLLYITSLCLLLIGCWKNNNETGIPKEEMPEMSPVCPEGFYWFESIKQCKKMENTEIED